MSAKQDEGEGRMDGTLSSTVGVPLLEKSDGNQQQENIGSLAQAGNGGPHGIHRPTGEKNSGHAKSLVAADVLPAKSKGSGVKPSAPEEDALATSSKATPGLGDPEGHRPARRNRDAAETETEKISTVDTGEEVGDTKKRARPPVSYTQKSSVKEIKKKARCVYSSDVADSEELNNDADMSVEESRHPSTQGDAPPAVQTSLLSTISHSGKTGIETPGKECHPEAKDTDAHMDSAYIGEDQLETVSKIASGDKKMSAGIFDDAEEDETFDVSALKEPPTTAKEAGTGTSMRPDLVAAILGSSPKKVAASTSFAAPAPVPAPAPVEAPKMAKKEEKKKRSTRKLYRAKREQEGAEKLLKGRLDLSSFLPEKHCRFLAKTLWIVTKQQLELLMKEGTAQLDARRELIDALVQSNLLVQALRSESEKVEKSEVGNVRWEEASENRSSDSMNTGRLVEVQTSGDERSRDKDVPPDPLVDLRLQENRDVDNSAGNDEISSVKDSDNGVKASASNAVLSTQVKDESEAQIEEDTEVQSYKTTGDAVSSSPNLKEAAELLLQSWKDKMKQAGQSLTARESDAWKKQFPLDGPLSCLIPTCTQNFFTSANIKSAYDILCLKKTETGVIVDMYAAWRKACGLKEVTAGTIAKHLLAIGARLEVAIGSSPAPTKEEREWYGGYAIVLSGAAKDFLFDYCKLYNSEDFIGRRTKEMADKLREWRISKGLEPLKGTGKVAMISAWKTLVKEAKEMEIDEGRVVESDEFMKGIEIEPDSSPKKAKKCEPSSVKMKPKASAPKLSASSVSNPQPAISDEGKTTGEPSVTAEDALKSDEFLASVLKKDAYKMLASSGIKTAQQLLDVDKSRDSDLIRSIIQMRRDYSGMTTASVEPSSCVQLVNGWCQQVKQRLAKFEKMPAQKYQSNDKVMGSKSGEKNANGPFNALSTAAKDFLAAVDVNDAETFLAAKTKTLAEALIQYREDRKMPPLKGLGSVASISGWKAIVRKAAQAAGEEKLVHLNAGRNFGMKLNRRPKGKEKAQAAETAPEQEEKDWRLKAANLDTPNFSSKTEFWVEDGQNIYCFELTIRTCSFEKSKDSWFLSYLGNKNGSSGEDSSIDSDQASKKERMGLTVLKPVEKTTNSRAIKCQAFSSSTSGLLELSRYGVSPLPRQGDISLLMRTIKAFVFQRQDRIFYDQTMAYNVFRRRSLLGEEYLFHTSKPMEKGQTVELCFLPLVPPASAGPEKELELRKWLESEISLLKAKDLRLLLDFLNEDIGGTIYPSIDKHFQRSETKNEELQDNLKVVSELLISRRRMHWLALRINSALTMELQSKSVGTALLPNVACTPLWTKSIISCLRKHDEWSKRFVPLLIDECKDEILTDFMSEKFGDFGTSRKIWCPLAKELFEDTICLISQFSLQLDAFASEQKIMDDLYSMSFRSISKLKEVDEGDKNSSDLALLSLHYSSEGDSIHSSNNFPQAESIRALLNRDYLDGMSLCDEPHHPICHGNDLACIATIRSTADEESLDSPVFRAPEDVSFSKAKIDLMWYAQMQVLVVIECVALSSVAHLAMGAASQLNNIRARIREAASEALHGYTVPSASLESTRMGFDGNLQVPIPILQSGLKAKMMPDSVPIFFCIVWPLLRSAKWKLEAGASPSSVMFYPPGRKKDSKRTRLLKQEAALQRWKCARKTSELGLGYIPKLAKRMFVRCAALDADEDTPSNEVPKVAQALRQFEDSFRDAASTGNLSQIKLIVEYIESLFESLAPTVLYAEEAETMDLPEGARWCDSLGCDYLMRLLLVLPKILRHSDLTVQQLEDTSAIVTELTDFMVGNRENLFASKFQLPREQYESSHEFPRSIMSRLGDTVKNSESRDDPSPGSEITSASFREIVQPSDRHVLTDFVITVLDQLIICRATRDDLHKKGRRSFLALGSPGLVCRHCLGQNNDGKYFYSNLASLSTAATSIDKHVARCPRTSNEIKQRLVAARAKHADQKANVPPGAQSAFFARLWDRLGSLSKTSLSAEADMYVTLAPSAASPSASDPQQPSSADGSEFLNHIDLLAHLQNSSAWTDDPEFTTAMDKYYSCIAWGGAIYSTEAMPLNFSSEWVLAKLGHDVHNHK